MAKVKLYRDTRDGVICLRFGHRSTHADRRLPVVVDAKEWDGCRIIGNKSKDALNAQLSTILGRAQAELVRLLQSKRTGGLTAAQIRDEVCEVVLNETERKTDFFAFFEKVANSYQKKGTRDVYLLSLRWFKKYDANMSFDTISVAWLREHHEYMTRKGYDPDYISIQERNLRHVINVAIDEELTQNYPFRRFKVILPENAPVDISAEEIASIIYADDLTEPQARAAELFALEFYLIGINVADLYELEHTDLRHGRLHYQRNKTSKMYNIKIQPEAAEIIKRHKSSGQKLLDFFDNCTAPTVNGFAHWYNMRLQQIAKAKGIKRKVTSYTSRDTWSTIASEDLGVDVDTISRALGHSIGKSVTRGYINARDLKRVDDANRAVIDFVKSKVQPKT